VVVDILPSRAAILKFLEGRMVLQPASATPAFQSTNPISPMPMHLSSCLHELYDANILTPRFYTPAIDDANIALLHYGSMLLFPSYP
jgi:hypothetical protein